MNYCENCANKSIPRSTECYFCKARYLDGEMVSRPTHWKEKKPMTNADRIRAMTDEELADFISACGCPDHARDCRASCKDCTMEWLQQPAEGD